MNLVYKWSFKRNTYGFHTNCTTFVVNAVYKIMNFICALLSCFCILVHCNYTNTLILQIRCNWKIWQGFQFGNFVSFVSNHQFKNPANFSMLIVDRSGTLFSYNCVAIFYQATTTKCEMCSQIYLFASFNTNYTPESDWSSQIGE